MNKHIKQINHAIELYKKKLNNNQYLSLINIKQLNNSTNEYSIYKWIAYIHYKNNLKSKYIIIRYIKIKN